MSTEILFKEESYRIVGACFEVYRNQFGSYPKAQVECIVAERGRYDYRAKDAGNLMKDGI